MVQSRRKTAHRRHNHRQDQACRINPVVKRLAQMRRHLFATGRMAMGLDRQRLLQAPMERYRREAQLRRLLLPVPDRLVVTIPMPICLRELRPAWRGLRVRLASGKRVADRYAMRLILMRSIACSIRIAGKAKSRQQEREVRALARGRGEPRSSVASIGDEE